jgi:hypothetical protein
MIILILSSDDIANIPTNGGTYDTRAANNISLLSNLHPFCRLSSERCIDDNWK